MDLAGTMRTLWIFFELGARTSPRHLLPAQQGEAMVHRKAIGHGDEVQWPGRWLLCWEMAARARCKDIHIRWSL